MSKMINNKIFSISLMVFALFFCISLAGSVSAADPANNTTTLNTTNTTGLANSTMPKFGVNLNNTGQSNYTGPQTNNLKWNYTVGDEVRGPVTIGSDGTIYFGSFDHNFYAMNPDGTLKWSYATGDDINSGSAIATDGT
ncbi:MAG: PQQ-binding-like beta-propeller repeat protein, partial [Methanobacterium sp.]|uniref:PQQ-binding-like beta-propeller repeat protein n=1 Tax=Methanobacterium sp. TaxID=2164 RepID=UPI003C722DA4